MNTQEILNNLSDLERELQNIKSARVMAEETISSYQDTQKEISRLLDGLSKVGTSLVLLAKELKDNDASLSEKIKEAVGKIDVEVLHINQKFDESCDKTAASFNKSIVKTIENLRQETTVISGVFAEGNNALKGHLVKLESLHDSITEANDQVKSIKASSDSLHYFLKSSCANLAAAIEGINKNVAGISETLKEFDEKGKAVEDRLQNIESFIAEDSDIRKNNYGRLQKSSKYIQIYLIITLILLVFSISYPYVKEFMKI